MPKSEWESSRARVCLVSGYVSGLHSLLSYVSVRTVRLPPHPSPPPPHPPTHQHELVVVELGVDLVVGLASTDRHGSLDLLLKPLNGDEDPRAALDSEGGALLVVELGAGGGARGEKRSGRSGKRETKRWLAASLWQHRWCVHLDCAVGPSVSVALSRADPNSQLTCAG